MNTAQAGFPGEGIEFSGANGHLRIDRTKFEFLSAERGPTPLVVECRTEASVTRARAVKNDEFPPGPGACRFR